VKISILKLCPGRYYPVILERKDKIKNNKLRIWFGGLRYGEEVYSIIITLLEYISNPAAWDIKVLGTDISTRVLTRAKAGVYNVENLQSMPKRFS